MEPVSGTIRAIKKRMVLRLCPVTGGNPTRMTLATWRKMCKHHRTAGKAESALNQEVFLRYCPVCRGKRKPKELEIIP